MKNFITKNTWWLCVVLILFLCGVLYLAEHNFSLPYVDPTDEPNYYLAGLEWRGLFDNQGYYDSVPPAYIFIHTLLQPILESLNINGLAGTTQIMRLLSVGATLATLLCIALTARRIAGDFAGIIAGMAWGIAPLVVENGIYALPDPHVYLFTALALWLAVEALYSPTRRAWSVWSVIAGLIAITFKYPAVPAFAPGFLVALWVTYHERTRGIKLLAAQLALIAGVGVWLLFGYGVDFAGVAREGAIVREQGLGNILNATRVLNNILYSVFPLQTAPSLILIVCGVLAYLVAKRRIQTQGLALCLVLILTIPWLAASFYEVEVTKIRYVLPATTAVCVLLGCAFQQIRWALPKSVGTPLMCLIAVGLFAPQVSTSWQFVQERRLPDTRVELRTWFDANLDVGTVIVDADNHKTFNPIWGGIPHRQWVDWQEGLITDYPLAVWRERGLSYAAIPLWQVAELQATTEGQALLDSLLHLRTLPHHPSMRGAQMAFYRLWRMDVETNIQFSDHIRLVGYDLDLSNLQNNRTLDFRLYWQADQTPSANYSFFVHVTALESALSSDLEADTLLAQVDGSPARLERPTQTWRDSGETLISPLYTLTLPNDLARGEYQVLLGLYDYLTGERLLVEGQTAPLQLITLEIE